MTVQVKVPASIAAVAGIAAVTVRSTIRSRLFVVLMVVLAVTVIGLPLAVRGDGTAAGRVRVLISYTLGIASFILGIATLWSACGAVSLDKENKTLRMIAVKPAGSFQIWLGKWLGLLALNAALLLFTGLVMVAFLYWAIQPGRLDDGDRRELREELLTGRRVLHPVESPGEIVIPPGTSRQWTFELPRSLRSAVFIRFSALSTQRGLASVAGTWTVGPPDEPEAAVFPMSGTLEGLRGFRVPARAAGHGRRLTVTFANAPADRSASVLLNPEQPVELLVPESPFETNLLRALVVVLGYLALVAALGVTAGTLFSFPVATFTAAGAILIAVLVHSVSPAPADTPAIHAGTSGSQAEPVPLHAATKHITRALNAVVDPAVSYDPFTPLAEGTLVTWSFTGKAAAVLFVIYPGVLGCAGALVLRFREIAG